MYLPEGLGIYWRERDSIQLGLYSERSAVFEGLYPREVSLFNLLRSPCTPEDVSHWARSNQVDQERARKIWDRVSETGLAVNDTLPGSMALTEFNALTRAGAAHPTRTGTTAIEIHSTGLIGTLLALVLNQYGFSSIYFTDPGPVTESESRWLGGASYGQPVENAVRPLLRPGSKKATQTLVVAVSSRVYARHIARVALANDIPFLPVVVAEADVQIGPFVTGTPCVECVELHRQDQDEAWPVLASQGARLSILETDTASAFHAVSLVVSEILHVINHPELKPRLHSSILHVPPAPSWPTIEEIIPHEKCGCHALLSEQQPKESSSPDSH